jgi:Tfp pilus assembly protein PilV
MKLRVAGGAASGRSSTPTEEKGKISAARDAAGLAAFTLLEVMLAITIFFMAMFAILGVLTSGVRAASLLRNNGPTAGMILAQLSATNVLTEGSDSGTFKDVPVYDGYKWTSNTREVATNGLFQIDVVVIDSRGNQYSMMSALMYRPDSDNNKMGVQQQRR